MRQAMGIAVFSGMLGVTFFGLFLTPVFYVLLRALTGNRPLCSTAESSIVEAHPVPAETALQGGCGVTRAAGMAQR